MDVKLEDIVTWARIIDVKLMKLENVVPWARIIHVKLDG
jgi:hypothetical protein